MATNETITKNLGHATAYAFAVAGGYQGTQEEFEAGLAASAEYATHAQSDALKAEGLAVGQQNGVDVDSDSPYYHNNAKYYAERAEEGGGSGQGVAFVYGTQQAATNAWTGVLSGVDTLTDGMTISYYLPYDGDGYPVSLQLTLDSGDTNAYPVYYNGYEQVTTQYPADSVITLTFINNSWRRADYDEDTNTHLGMEVTDVSTVGNDVVFTVRTDGNVVPSGEGYSLIRFRTAVSMEKTEGQTGYYYITFDGTNSGMLTLYVDGDSTFNTGETLTIPVGTYFIYFDGADYQLKLNGTIPGIERSLPVLSCKNVRRDSVSSGSGYVRAIVFDVDTKDDFSDKGKSFNLLRIPSDVSLNWIDSSNPDTYFRIKLGSTFKTLYINDIQSIDIRQFLISKGTYLVYYDGTKYNLSTNGNLATTVTPGFMSAEDKSKLDGIASGANDYTLPDASTSVKGGVYLENAVTANSYNAVTSGSVYNEVSKMPVIEVTGINPSAQQGVIVLAESHCEFGISAKSHVILHNPTLRAQMFSPSVSDGPIKLQIGEDEYSLSVNGSSTFSGFMFQLPKGYFIAYYDTTKFNISTSGYEATANCQGFMSAKDKVKLDEVAESMGCNVPNLVSMERSAWTDGTLLVKSVQGTKIEFMTDDSISTSSYIGEMTNPTAITTALNDYVYVYAKMKADEVCSSFRISHCSETVSVSSPDVNTDYVVSGIIRATSTSAVSDNNGKVVYGISFGSITTHDVMLTVTDPIFVNLTQTFGSGKEPSKAEMDAIVAEKGWFEKTNILKGADVYNAINHMVSDVKIGNSSIVSNGVANIHIAGYTDYGVVKVDTAKGVAIGSGFLYVQKAIPELIKSGGSDYFPIVPSNQHQSVFYGLAKAAGDTTQALSSNSVGTYTQTAKSAINSMLGIGDYEIIKSVTLTEDSDSISITTDENGSAFKLKELAFIINMEPSTDTTQNSNMYIKVDPYNYISTMSGVVRTSQTNADGYVKIIRVATDNNTCTFVSACTSVQSGGYTYWNGKLPTSDSRQYSEYFEVYTLSPSKFGSGTELILFGVRA